MKRRRFLAGAAGLAGATAARAWAQPAAPPPVKTVRTPVLEIGYHESGPRPASRCCCSTGSLTTRTPTTEWRRSSLRPVIAPSRSTCAATARPASSTPAAPRTAEQAAIGQDVIDFADALRLPRFAVTGYDWGGRASCIAAALHPDRVRAAVLCGGYSIQNTVTPGPRAGATSGAQRLVPVVLQHRGRRAGAGEEPPGAVPLHVAGVVADLEVLRRRMYELTAPSFDNPDFVDCVMHSYRHRNFNAPGEPRFLEVEKRLAARPKVAVPTVVLHGDDDGFGRPAPETTPAERELFPNLVARRVVAGAGHFVPTRRPTRSPPRCSRCSRRRAESGVSRAAPDRHRSPAPSLRRPVGCRPPARPHPS